jgi:hypothetical protein
MIIADRPKFSPLRQKPIPRLRPRRSAVTIAAAMRCQGGVILCADSLASGMEINLSQSKIVIVNLPELRANLAIAFSGGISHCMSAISSIGLTLRKIPASKGPLTEELLKFVVEDVLARFYKKHMYPDPHFGTWTEDSVCLLIILQNIESGGTSIFSTEKTVVNLHREAAFIGAGAALARYVTEPLVCISVASMPDDKVLLLADHMLQQVKRFVPSCGDESHFFFVSNAMGFCPITREPLLARERSDTFRQIIAELFYASADLDLDDELVRIGLHMTDKRIRNIREEQRDERERRQKLGSKLFARPLIGRGPEPMEKYDVRPSDSQTSEDQQ